jgi:ribonuclease P protein component
MPVRRLQTRPQFQALLACPASARSEHFVMHRMDLAQPDPATAVLFAGSAQWIGAMVPKRWARRAVTRNLIKRQLYALADLGGLQQAPGAYLVRLRSSFHAGQKGKKSEPIKSGLFVSAASDVLKQAVRTELAKLLVQSQRRQEPRA